MAAQVVFFPMPAGVALQGLTIGLLGALVALGMALIYRSNRIINFAQADLGFVSTSLVVHLIVLSGLNYFLALGIGLVAALAVGAIVELAFIRRFFHAPRLILTVATIGIAQLLTFVAFMLPPWLWGEDPTFRGIDAPLSWKLTVEPLIFDADYFLAWMIAPVCMVAIALFLRFTDVGIAIRASAEGADRAALLGVPVKRLHTYVWAVGGLLAFVAMFLRAGISGLPFGQALGFTLLLSALAALTLGKFTDITTIALSAVALGLLEQGVSWNDELDLFLFKLDISSALVVAPVMGAVIVVGLLLQRPGSSRAERDSSSTWRSAEEVRPTPVELRSVGEVRLARWLGLCALAAAALALPHLLEAGDSLKASAVVIFAIIGISVVVLTGWAGQVSLGQMAFVAVGAAIGAIATREWGLDLTLASLVAGAGGAIVAMIVGLPALRLRGLYLAVTTLAFALATTSYFLNQQFWTWVPSGRVERPDLLGQWSIDTPTRMYYVALASFLLAVGAVLGIRRSRTGRVLVAMRENEQGIQSYGVSVVRAKLTAFALSGFIAAFAGSLLVHHQRSFSLGLFPPEENLVVFTATVVGGLGSLTGAVLGAIFLKGGQWFLPGEWRLLASALGVLIVLWAVPGGLAGQLFRLRDSWLRWVALRRGIAVPSLLADTGRAEEEAETEFESRAREMAGAPSTSETAPSVPDGAVTGEAARQVRARSETASGSSRGAP